MSAEAVGIESVGFYVPCYFVDMRRLAAARGVDPAKYLQGLGQHRMCVAPPDEDVVTMAASAAHLALQDVDISKIDSVFFATESGIDQSKAAAIYVHRLLGLPPACKTVEFKQACASSTVAFLTAQALVASGMDRKALVVAADVARYELGSPAEPTQGAGAVAMVVSRQPRLMRLENGYGAHTEDVMDFWRPNYRREALVDGKYSIKVYIRSLCAAWKRYHAVTGRAFADHQRFCYHLPFTRMAEKAHAHLVLTATGKHASRGVMARDIDAGLIYNREIGNTYTASLYIALCSLLENEELPAGSRIGLFAYGSGCLGIFFSTVLTAGYRRRLHREEHRRQLRERIEISVEEYERMYHSRLPEDGSRFVVPVHRTGPFRLAAVENHQRIYEGIRPRVSADERSQSAMAAQTTC